MVRLVRLLVGFLALLLIAAFAVANRTEVGVSVPFIGPIEVPFAGAEVPVYWVFLFGLIVGVLVGAIGVRLTDLNQRRQAKRLRGRVWALENQLDLIKKQEQKARAEGYTAQKAIALQAAAGD